MDYAEEDENERLEDVMMVYVKWKHFDTTENSWEPLSELTDCREYLSEFMGHLKNVSEIDWTNVYIMDI